VSKKSEHRDVVSRYIHAKGIKTGSHFEYKKEELKGGGRGIIQPKIQGKQKGYLLDKIEGPKKKKKAETKSKPFTKPNIYAKSPTTPMHNDMFYPIPPSCKPATPEAWVHQRSAKGLICERTQCALPPPPSLPSFRINIDPLSMHPPVARPAHSRHSLQSQPK
jgi:hypothetical protein